MGWSNQQALTLDGQSFTYLNSDTEYGSGSTLTVDDGAALTVDGSTVELTGGSSLTIDVTSTLDVPGIANFPGVQNFTGTVNLDHTLTTLDGTTMVVTGGSSITLDATSTISTARGLVAYNRAVSDLPALGTAAASFATAASVITTTLSNCVQGRVYQITCPALSVRMNVAARTGVFMTFTENGAAPTTASASLGEQYVNCITVGSPVPVPISCLYVRTAATGSLKVALWIWNVSGGGATVANGTGGPTTTPIELQIIDWGVDPGATA